MENLRLIDHEICTTDFRDGQCIASPNAQLTHSYYNAPRTSTPIPNSLLNYQKVLPNGYEIPIKHSLPVSDVVND